MYVFFPRWQNEQRTGDLIQLKLGTKNSLFWNNKRHSFVYDQIHFTHYL